MLHLVAADRFTGAAAPALLLVEALRGAGVQAALAIRGGHNLQARVGHHPWVYPVLAKERSLADLRRAVQRVDALATGFDLVHCHLPHDHALARLALRRRRGGPALVRSLRHPRHLRRDPFHRFLLAGTHAVAFATSALAQRWRRWDNQAQRPTVVLPPAVEERVRRRGDREGTRARLGFPAEAVVAGTVGKLHRERGQDIFLRALAAAPAVWGLVVGQGEHAEELRRLAVRLGIEERVRFPGYADADLADYYAAMDLFVFPAAGSDWGHRAIAEAMVCGLPVLAAQLEGVRDLVQPPTTGEVYPPFDAAALAVRLRAWGADRPRREAARGRALAIAANWTEANLAAVILPLYQAVAPRPGRAAGG